MSSFSSKSPLFSLKLELIKECPMPKRPQFMIEIQNQLFIIHNDGWILRWDGKNEIKALQKMTYLRGGLNSITGNKKFLFLQSHTGHIQKFNIMKKTQVQEWTWPRPREPRWVWCPSFQYHDIKCYKNRLYVLNTEAILVSNLNGLILNEWKLFSPAHSCKLAVSETKIFMANPIPPCISYFSRKNGTPLGTWNIDRFTDYQYQILVKDSYIWLLDKSQRIQVFHSEDGRLLLESSQNIALYDIAISMSSTILYG